MTTVDHSAELIQRTTTDPRLTLLSRLMLRLCVPTLILLLWSAASLLSPGIASVLPPPHQVVASLWHEAIAGPLLLHIAVSLVRALGGFIVAGCVGVSLGLLMSQSRTGRYLL